MDAWPILTSSVTLRGWPNASLLCSLNQHLFKTLLISRLVVFEINNILFSINSGVKTTHQGVITDGNVVFHVSPYRELPVFAIKSEIKRSIDVLPHVKIQLQFRRPQVVLYIPHYKLIRSVYTKYPISKT